MSSDAPQGKKQPFLVEESSKATVQHISTLMRSDYAWCCIALIAYVATEAERIGVWSEQCPCPEHQPEHHQPRKTPKRKRQVKSKPGASTCCLKCCRAPELAVGAPLEMQSRHLESTRAGFGQYVATAPEHKKAELQGSFTRSVGLLWGTLFVFEFLFQHVSGIYLVMQLAHDANANINN